jgi:catechol 2,3-dioxygenase
VSTTDRLPANTHLGSVRLQVSDLTRSTDYYERILGLRILDRDGERASLGTFEGNTALLHLETRPVVQRASGARFGLYHFALLVPSRADLGRFVTHLGGLGVRVASADHAVSEALYLWDPDGLGIEVYADRPRETWQRRDGELVMVTEPLDLRDVARAAEGTRWGGMPRGTVLGHMHLHVGDLEQGAAFYDTALGFDKTVWSYPGALFLSAGGYHHHLGTNTWGRGAVPRSENEAGLVEWDIIVRGADAADTARRLDAHGHAVGASADGYRVSDPWGTRIRLRAI